MRISLGGLHHVFQIIWVFVYYDVCSIFVCCNPMTIRMERFLQGFSILNECLSVICSILTMTIRREMLQGFSIVNEL